MERFQRKPHPRQKDPNDHIWKLKEQIYSFTLTYILNIKNLGFTYLCKNVMLLLNPYFLFLYVITYKYVDSSQLV